MKLTRRNDSKSTPATTSLSADPFRNMLSVQDAMNRIFNDSFLSPFFSESMRLGSGDTFGSLTPRVDVSETEKEIKMRMDVPGLKKDDINIEVAENMIALSGTIEKSEEEKKENFYRMEREYGTFSREFMLPSKVDAKKVNAVLKDGVLTITLQKQPSEQSQKVMIKGA